MHERVIWARIVEHTPTQFLVVVSSSAVDMAKNLTGDLRTADVGTRAEAMRIREALISIVQSRVQDRGQTVVRIERID